MMAVPALVMIIFTSAKSVLMRPGVVIRSVMPCTPCSSTSSAILKALTIDVFSLDTVSSRSFGMTMRVSTFSLQLLDAGLGLHRAAPALEGERPGDHADGERAERLGDLGDDRRGTGPGAAALAGGDEHHVGALEHLLDLLAVLLGRLATDLGVAAGAEPAVSSRPMSSLTSASLISSAWASVLTAMNSTPFSPASIMRLTALTPPPPTPTTLMTAR